MGRIQWRHPEHQNLYRTPFAFRHLKGIQRANLHNNRTDFSVVSQPKSNPDQRLGYERLWASSLMERDWPTDAVYGGGDITPPAVQRICDLNKRSSLDGTRSCFANTACYATSFLDTSSYYLSLYGSLATAWGPMGSDLELQARHCHDLTHTANSFLLRDDLTLEE